MIKLFLFADDMTCILKDKTSYLNLFYVLESFGECSGLKVNDEKTEVLALGNNSLQESDFPKHNLCEVIKILGIYFGYDVRQRDNLNFRKTLKSIKEISQSMEMKRPLPFRKDTNSQNFCYPKVYV